MTTTPKRTQRDYSFAFKLAVVDQVEKGELTYKQAQSKYGIQGRSTVLIWLRKHGRLNWEQGASPLHPKGDLMNEANELTPEQRIKALETELVETKRKAEFFEHMIMVLKRDYGVNVSKKPLAKRSKKRK